MTRGLPIQLKLTLWSSVVLTGAMLLFAAGVYVLLGNSLLNNVDVGLRQRINQLMPSVDVSNNHIQLRQVSETPDNPYIPGTVVTLSGRPLTQRLPASLQQWLKADPSRLRQSLKGTTVDIYRVRTGQVENNNRPLGYLLVWQSLAPVRQAQQALLLLLFILGPALLLIALLGEMLLARRVLTPVADITRAAASISATDLGARVDVPPSDDELSRLAKTFNAMIERLQAAVERERRFTADASHELRSPLAVIMAESSLALEEPVDPQSYLQALRTVYEQARGMRDVLDALLTLSRSETLLRSRRDVGGSGSSVAVKDVVEGAVRLVRPRADERGVAMTTSVSENLRVSGDLTLLVRALGNLLDNAVKVSPPGSSVMVLAKRGKDGVELRVNDSGPGIAAEELERIFEPFYQVDTARTPGDSHGLGLAICQRIISAHRGTVSASSDGGLGASFLVVLPAAPSVDHRDALEGGAKDPLKRVS